MSRVKGAIIRNTALRWSPCQLLTYLPLLFFDEKHLIIRQELESVILIIEFTKRSQNHINLPHYQSLMNAGSEGLFHDVLLGSTVVVRLESHVPGHVEEKSGECPCSKNVKWKRNNREILSKNKDSLEVELQQHYYPCEVVLSQNDYHCKYNICAKNLSTRPVIRNF